MRASASASMRWRVSGVSGRVQRDEVGRSQRRVQVVAEVDHEHLHVEARRALGHGLADAPGADDRERRAVDVGADPALRLPRAPLAVAHVLARPRRGAGATGEHEGPGEVGGRVGEHVGRVADLDVARRPRPRGRCCRSRSRSWPRPAAAARRPAAPRRPCRPASTAARRRRRRARQQVLARRRHVALPDLDVVLGGEALERVAGESGG